MDNYLTENVEYSQSNQKLNLNKSTINVNIISKNFNSNVHNSIFYTSEKWFINLSNSGIPPKSAIIEQQSACLLR